MKQMCGKHKTNRLELSVLIDMYLIPNANDIKMNAEISTPHALRQEMLDKIPAKFWSTPRKVFEPCCGKGGFVNDIVGRFMDGLKTMYPDEELRYKYIVENCVYFSDINSDNISVCKMLLDPLEEYSLNYNQGNTLELDVQDKWGLLFDAVVGNPPYQDVSKTGKSKGGGNNLYSKFIYHADKCIVQNGYLLFINPPTYFSPGRANNKTGMSVRKDILDNYFYHFINLEECAKHFNVGSKFMYYLCQKTNEKNRQTRVVCKFNNKVYDTILDQTMITNVDYLPYLLNASCIRVCNRIKTTVNKLNIFHSPDNRSDKKHVLKRNTKESFEDYKARAHATGHVFPIQATGSQVVFSSKQCKNQKDNKVLMSESGYLKPIYDDGVLGVGGHCFCYLVRDREEGQRVIKLLNSKLYKFYIQANKWSGYHHINVMKDLVQVEEELTDQQMYEHFNLTDDEIKLIEETVK